MLCNAFALTTRDVLGMQVELCLLRKVQSFSDCSIIVTEAL